MITSEAPASKNRIETGTLQVEDVDTHSKWKATSYGGSIGSGGVSIAPPIKEGDTETGKALSAVPPAEISITNPDGKRQNIDDLRRDTANTNTLLPGLPDLQKMLRDQYETQECYHEASAMAANMIGDWSTKLYIAATTDTERELWKEGGAGRTALHTIAGGLLGGATDINGMLSGAFGGGSSAFFAPKVTELVAEFVKQAGLTGSAADLMTNSVAGGIVQGIGSITGGAGAAYAGAAYQYNYLKHAEIIQYHDEMRQCGKELTCQYKVFSKYFDISADRNDEVEACQTEQCRKTHYDDFIKAK